MSKLTKVFFRGSIVSVGRFLGAIERAEVDALAIWSYIRIPFPAFFIPTHTLETRSVSRTSLHILMILRSAASTQVASSIVQRIVVAVIAFIPRSAPRQYAMHSDESSSFASDHHRFTDCIEAFRSIIPERVPLPLRQKGNIFLIDDGHLTLRKWDKRWFHWSILQQVAIQV
jgi:hypothetical protein